MTSLNPTIKNLRALVVGQMRTSRTEDLSRYLSGQVVKLTVISFRTPLTSDPCIKIETYTDAITAEPKSQILWQRQRRHSGPLSRIEPLLIFITYGLRILAYLRSCRNEHDMVIGVATFSSLICMIAKRLGWQSYTLIYYCLDYYLQPASGVANRVIFKCYKLAERLLIRNSDTIWDISPRIKHAREQFDRIPIASYQAHTVPLGYFDIRAGDPVAAENRTRNAVGFVGTLSENQGLQLVFQALGQLCREIPDIHLHVIGNGPMRGELESLVGTLQIENNVTFYGFVEDDRDAYEILKACRVGLATWTGHEGDNSVYADPGKPKLYALLGLPVVITKSPFISDLIDKLDAGYVIDYDLGCVTDAIRTAVTDDREYARKLANLENFKPFSLAEEIFDGAFNSLWYGHEYQDNR